MVGKIFRIRMSSGVVGGDNLYHYADVVETHYQRALTAAKQGRVRNWRAVDSFGPTVTESYKEFEYLYQVGDSESRRSARPLEKGV